MKPEVQAYLTEQFGDSSLVIVGLGREGLSTYQLLHEALPTAHITLVDDKPLDQLHPSWQELLTHDSLAVFNTTQKWLATAKIDPSQIVFLTPGIPLQHPIRTAIAAQHLSVTSNTQVFLEIVQKSWPSLKTIGVTGTKGKSTTTSMVHHLLQTAGLKSVVGGNLGKPPLELLAELDTDTNYAVLELSAHQLDLCTISPQIAIIQNVAPEHLDYYQTFERYFEAKSHLTKFQHSSDQVIFNPAWETAHQIAALSPGQPASFVTHSEPESSTRARLEGQTIQIRPSETAAWQTVMQISEVPLPGTHNLENILPSVVLGVLLKVAPEVIRDAITSFKGLQNRLEKVTEINGVSYYNDSLATVQEATIAALHAFKDHSIILLAGGFDRGQPLTRLAQALLNQKIKLLLLFPTTGERLASEIQVLNQAPAFEIKKVESMDEAVKLANEQAAPGDIVLLSPAAASFNLFKDYQDRGDTFKEAITNLVTK